MRKPAAGRKVHSTERALARTNLPIAGELVAPRMPAADARPVPSWTQDGFENVVSGIGTTRDKRSYNNFSTVTQLTLYELQAMYRGNWVAAKIVDKMAEDSTKKWVALSWDGRDEDKGTVKSIEVAENYFNVRAKVTEAIKWARLYGGSGIVLGIKGQADWSQPLKIESVKKGSLELLHVLDRWRLAATGAIDSDRSSPNFGQPLYYTIAEAAQQVSLIHWTRVIRFDGKRIPYFEWQRNGRWHDSVLQNIDANVKDYENVRASINSMVDEANVDILSIRGLLEMMSTPDGEAKIIKRVALGAALKSNTKVWLIDGGPKDGTTGTGGDTYSQKVTQFSGVAGVFEAAKDDVCGAASMPMTTMFGRSPGGLNSTGDGDKDNWNASVEAYQTSEVYAPLCRLYEVLVRHVTGSMPVNFGIEFNPLSQLSATEKADTELKRAQRDKIYAVDIGLPIEGVIAGELKDDGVYPNMEDEDVELAKELATEPEPVPVVVAPGGKAPTPAAKPPAAAE